MFKISLRFFLIFLDINRYAILQKSDIPISYNQIHSPHKNVRLNWMEKTNNLNKIIKSNWFINNSFVILQRNERYV